MDDACVIRRRAELVSAYWARFAPSLDAAHDAIHPLISSWLCRETTWSLGYACLGEATSEALDGVQRSVDEAVAHVVGLTSDAGGGPGGNGRFLLWTDVGVVDGASMHESGHFFDELDRPPAWTWIGSLAVPTWIWNQPAGALLAWVPADLVESTDRGIGVNPVEALQWLDVADPVRNERLWETPPALDHTDTGGPPS